MDATQRLEKRKLLRSLLQLREHGPTNPAKGICYNVAGEGWLSPLFISWSEWSGSPFFPVPYYGPAYRANEAYFELPKWNIHSTYGRARWRLVDHCIGQLTKELENA